jgi:hypothetical protein
VLLQNVLAERPSFVTLSLRDLLCDSAIRCRLEDAASDFRAAYAKGQAIFDAFSAERKKRRMEEAIREVDGYQAVQ